MLKSKNKGSGIGEPPITFCTSYSPQYKEITSIIQKHIPILYADETMIDIITTPMKCVSRRACTIGNLVSPSMVQMDNSNRPWLYTAGFFKCGHKKCKACLHAQITKEMPKSAEIPERRIYPICSYINCNSTYVVHMITCTDCNLQYIV